MLFVKLAPATFALHAIVAYHRRQHAPGGGEQQEDAAAEGGEGVKKEEGQEGELPLLLGDGQEG